MIVLGRTANGRVLACCVSHANLAHTSHQKALSLTSITRCLSYNTFVILNHAQELICVKTNDESCYNISNFDCY